MNTLCMYMPINECGIIIKRKREERRHHHFKPIQTTSSNDEDDVDVDDDDDDDDVNVYPDCRQDTKPRQQCLDEMRRMIVMRLYKNSGE